MLLSEPLPIVCGGSAFQPENTIKIVYFDPVLPGSGNKKDRS